MHLICSRNNTRRGCDSGKKWMCSYIHEDDPDYQDAVNAKNERERRQHQKTRHARGAPGQPRNTPEGNDDDFDDGSNGAVNDGGDPENSAHNRGNRRERVSEGGHGRSDHQRANNRSNDRNNNANILRSPAKQYDYKKLATLPLAQLVKHAEVQLATICETVHSNYFSPQSTLRGADRDALRVCFD